jgi:UV DNA damage endonuclease
LLLRDVLLYLAEQRICFYRVSDALVSPLVRTNPAELRAQCGESASLLYEIGVIAREHKIRLTMHLGMHVVLSTPDEAIAQRSIAEVIGQACVLEALGLDEESVMVAHIGGANGDRIGALQRFAVRYKRLPSFARARLVVELDESSFDMRDLLALNRMCGVPIVLDTLHFQMNNVCKMPLAEALGLALATWPANIRPKVHFSTQRTEAHLREAKRGVPAEIIPPRRGQHADFINPFEFASFLSSTCGLPPFDVMLEAKAADLALVRLREDLRTFVPNVAARVD